MNRQDVYRAIDSERDYQDGKWGTVEQNPHTVQEWIAILNEEIEEANWEFSDSDALAELRQVAAVCIAALEQHGCQPREGYAQDTQPGDGQEGVE